MRFEILGRRVWLVVASALTAATAAHAQQHVFARGEDGTLKHYDGARWQSLGGQFVGSPDACSWGPGRIDVVVRGTDNKLWQIALVNGTWSPWIPHDGNLASSPTCVSWGPNRIDVFAVEAGTRAIHRKAWDGAQWSGWQSIGGEFPAGAAPDAVSNGVNDIAVVARGMDGAVWSSRHSAGGWEGWQPLGQPANSDPGAVARAGRVEVFVQGGDNQMLHHAGGTWTGRGGVFRSGDGPDGVATGSDYVVYVRGSDGELWRGRGGDAGFAGWDKVGGRIASDPATVATSGAGGTGSPAPARARGRFRVTLTGFKVNRATWDDITSSDGKWDEVFFVVDSGVVHRNGTLSAARGLRGAVVIGDTNGNPQRRRGGSASDLGGLMEGDAYPVSEDALRRPPASIATSAGDPPFVIFDGELVDGETAAVVVPTIWEWDPPTHLHDQWVTSLSAGLGACARRADANLWTDAAVFRIAAMCAPTSLRLSTIRIGEAASRPIGMTPARDHYTFNAWVVAMNYRGAATATAAGPGVIRVRYVDWEDLRGDYDLFLVVERVG